MKREIANLKVVSAYEDPRIPGSIFARVEDGDGNTQTVQVPDWADKDAIKQEAARQQANSGKKMKARKDLED